MDINVLGICASPVQGGNTQILLETALKAAASQPGVQTQMVPLAGKEIQGCRHCNWCMLKQTQEEHCVQKDDMAALYPLVLGADALLLATPVYIGRLSGYLATFMDRLRALIYGKVYRAALVDKVGGALAVGWYRHAGLETTLQSVVAGFLTLGMVPSSTPHCPWGAPALASQTGTGAFDKARRHGVLDDRWGLEAAEALAKRSVHLALRMKQPIRPDH
ncbi:MAG: flavodoxin family protein [Thermodesulfobacteriota bacterium]